MIHCSENVASMTLQAHAEALMHKFKSARWICQVNEAAFNKDYFWLSEVTKDAVYNAMLDHLNEILMNEPHDVHFDLDEHDEVTTNYVLWKLKKDAKDYSNFKTSII